MGRLKWLQFQIAEMDSHYNRTFLRLQELHSLFFGMVELPDLSHFLQLSRLMVD